ncbi:MAG: DUF6311 domain-containing protein, partial [Lachnospiraceae bacterium]|nr:DUF6311 domain-containing protein [Lachnospiraceae bacterium]
MIKLDRHVKWYISFAEGAVFGALVFILLYGVQILNVTYDDWLLTGWYDLSQHYVGWKLYRASGWHFPIGLCDNSFYPYLASVIYTDSIPLFSFIFKLLSPILPETFQFFGLYGLFCFMMQGGMAKLLLRRVLKSEALCCVACIPFVFCAPVWQRMYYHTALSSHYLILLALLFFLYRDKLDKTRKRVVSWCILGVLCILIHFTIYGIVSVMFLGFIIWDLLDIWNPTKSDDGFEHKQDIKDKITAVIKRSALYLVSYLAVTCFTFYLFGGFYGNITADAEG